MDCGKESPKQCGEERGKEVAGVGGMEMMAHTGSYPNVCKPPSPFSHLRFAPATWLAKVQRDLLRNRRHAEG